MLYGFFLLFAINKPAKILNTNNYLTEKIETVTKTKCKVTITI